MIPSSISCLYIGTNGNYKVTITACMYYLHEDMIVVNVCLVLLV